MEREDEKYIYIKNLILDDIQMILTFRSNANQQNMAQNMLTGFGLNMALTVGQLENASITLTKKVVYHYYDKESELIPFIGGYYKSQLNYKIGKLFLSIDLFGNTT